MNKTQHGTFSTKTTDMVSDASDVTESASDVTSRKESLQNRDRCARVDQQHDPSKLEIEHETVQKQGPTLQDCLKMLFHRQRCADKEALATAPWNKKLRIESAQFPLTQSTLNEDAKSRAVNSKDESSSSFCQHAVQKNETSIRESLMSDTCLQERLGRCVQRRLHDCLLDPRLTGMDDTNMWKLKMLNWNTLKMDLLRIVADECTTVKDEVGGLQVKTAMDALRSQQSELLTAVEVSSFQASSSNDSRCGENASSDY